MTTREDTAVTEVLMEYRVNKVTTSKVNKNFYVQFRNHIQTEWRKRIKCDVLIKAPSMGDSSMRKHFNACSETTT